MTKLIQKILLVAFIIISSQVVQGVQAQSYQRWIYWVGNENHQLTAREMGEITEKLFNQEIIPDKVFNLSSGVSLRIPQPNLFLRYIRISVMSVRPWASSREDILDAIYKADRFRWGNDVVIRVKNHWVSDQNKKVTYTNNYSGEGKNSFFLFIDGIPAVKCDCGNPLELMPEYYSYRHQRDERINTYHQEERMSQQVSQPRSTDFVAPRTVREMATQTMPAQQPISDLSVQEFDWTPVIVVGGIVVLVSGVYLIKSLLKKETPIGGPAGVPGHNDPGGPGGAPGHGP